MTPLPSWIVILQGLLTPMIATVVAYIAYQQFQVNRRKLVLDLYDRRLKVFQSTVAFIAAVYREQRARPKDLKELSHGTAEAVFLFEPEIAQFLGCVTELTRLSMIAIRSRRTSPSSRNARWPHPSPQTGSRASLMLQKPCSART